MPHRLEPSLWQPAKRGRTSVAGGTLRTLSAPGPSAAAPAGASAAGGCGRLHRLQVRRQKPPSTIQLSEHCARQMVCVVGNGGVCRPPCVSGSMPPGVFEPLQVPLRLHAHLAPALLLLAGEPFGGGPVEAGGGRRRCGWRGRGLLKESSPCRHSRARLPCMFVTRDS
jgi:hypothetical protein